LLKYNNIRDFNKKKDIHRKQNARQRRQIKDDEKAAHKATKIKG